MRETREREREREKTNKSSAEIIAIKVIVKKGVVFLHLFIFVIFKNRLWSIKGERKKER